MLYIKYKSLYILVQKSFQALTALFDDLHMEKRKENNCIILH